MKLNIIAFDGDGIGPEIVSSTLDVINLLNSKLKLDIEIQREILGFNLLKKNGVTFTDDLLLKSKKADGIILGPVDHNAYPSVSNGGINPSAKLRIEQNMDLVIVRENTEGFYADRNMYDGSGEFSPVPGVGLSLRKITKEASLKIAKSAFEIAKSRSVKKSIKSKVHVVHKANVMKITDGIFLDACRHLSSKYNDVDYEEMLVDACAAHLVRKPDQFDVIVTTNMFGDILSDLATELSGSLGLAGSLNAGSNHAMAQAQHGAAPDIADKNIANPISLILSSAMLLDWLGKNRKIDKLILASNLINDSVLELLKDKENFTRDLGGNASTSKITENLIKILNKII
jgi:3-isopropylmalate dehydrogenase